ncbi:MAG TPA: YafY family protein [Vitreimonas sp.]|uniref:helix-turn-helix transcriptional regulator n=1 Tax=Vitreimonas sp. TaxID=3069702 RepID=UPI002D648E07|nr:YafY family protein [Vitreimonas sp.]HYD89733.1 YafY family protein [Vitreimonas sp.]
MRSSRLLSILLMLQSRGRMSAQALAEEFEVSVRTIYRDIDNLSAAGVPVYAERGRDGGFELLDGYRTQLTGLTASEAEALLFAGLPGPAADLGLADAMADAQLKLMAALPREKRESAERIASRFHLDPVGWYQHADRAELLPALAAAVWTSQRIRVRYESWKGIVERDLDPLGLALKGGVWYLVARAGGKPRTYRISNIRALETLSESFTRPRDFKLAEYWKAWAQDFEARLYKGKARVRVSAVGMKALCALAPAVQEMASRTAGRADKHGWREAEIPIESVDHAARELLKLGAEAEVLAPPELRKRMGEAAAALGAIYAEDGKRRRPRARRAAA